ncbi:DNA polymerase III subunit gamma/tau [Undibacterium oligocarboniphilum]|uniref:DNA polymerase III subunit gamma/tau n=1 Tax=Undibacterium oligocarboniphilum TaxID=666702 RepID=A0A850QKY1_9BURK|nr:DNA polymerase III subunit gamma/tau [Undibacterium oligocarboniphilum]MBC3870204.1 DNA polymerase III subunit gamma/tau [Undibacterium oligocarboniphilum]NVO78195.1 DNA polymerase III subunit gamma/tau [Undibacterium oligocarboniphilum]
MSYQVLARKYRPRSFQTLVGQEHVVRALTHALEQQRLHHAYLFTGTRGVGKTTLSRILAKSFNCEQGITANPCGVCEACTAIDAGRFVDYIEMDAASNRGVDEMASLLEQAIYAPSNARFKVYMIDEVHMLTNHAFNAMLKTLEEPPEHVKFILATTDPQKIPVTVLSRCLQFNLKQMPPGHIIGHLENILTQEQIGFEVPALRLLAQGAQGSMRDALSLTDQAIAYAAGQVSLESVQGMLGALDQSYLIRLLDALAANDGKALLDVADEMAARSLSYKAALQDLGTLLHQIAIAQLVPAAVAEDLPEREQVVRLASVFTKEEIQLYYQIAVHGRHELALAPDEYAGFSMTLLRMLAFRPAEGGEATDPGAAYSGGGAARGVLPLSMSPQSTHSGVKATAAQSAQSSAALSISSPARSAVPASNVNPVFPPVVTQVRNSVTADITPAAAPPAQKPMSPAMAALAAARAASAGVKGAGGGATQPASPVMPVVQSAAAAPAAVPLPEKKAVTDMPSQSSSRMTPENLADTQRTDNITAPDSSPAESDMPVSMEAQTLTMDDMPPPWDDDILQVSVAKNTAGASQNLPTGVSHMRNEDDVPAAHQSGAISAPEPAVLDRQLWQAPVAALDWDGRWPTLAANLPVRGVTQQLAQQSELADCRQEGNVWVFELRVPLPTLLSAGSSDKLATALSERFSRTVRVEHKIGAVELTANAEAIAERELRQKQAEQSIRKDHFVQTLMREFGAVIVTGSVRPV